MADWTGNSDFGALAATREPIFRPSREAAPAGLRAEPRVPREEAPRLSPGVAALAQYNAGHGGTMAKARLAVWAGGGALSLALIAGVGVWGYKLVLREVMGLPVVAAQEGPMRILPADPQGEVVPSQGLAVNAIPAAGTAAPPSDVLVLAPQAPGLAEEDLLVVQTRAEAGEVMPVPVVSAVAADPLALIEVGAEAPVPVAAPLAASAPAAAPVTIQADMDLSGSLNRSGSAERPASTGLASADTTSMNVGDTETTAQPVAALVPPNPTATTGEILTVAAQAHAGSQALAAAVAAPTAPATVAPAAPAAVAPAAPVEAVPPQAMATAAPAGAVLVTAAAPAPAPSLRPSLRPPSLRAAVAAPAAPSAAPLATSAPPAATTVASVVPAPSAAVTSALPAGTNLVQLGAFDSAEVAAAEWDRLQTRFGDFLGGKERVIQEAQSDGRTFFRLRALGFADRADARRLCAALTAESAACIPVTVD